MFQGLCNPWRTGPNTVSKEDDLPETKAFLRELGGLPLAIEQRAAYAAFREKTISQLHNEFTRSFKRIAGGISTKRVTGSDSVIDSSAMTLATVGTCSLQKYARLWLALSSSFSSVARFHSKRLV